MGSIADGVPLAAASSYVKAGLPQAEAMSWGSPTLTISQFRIMNSYYCTKPVKSATVGCNSILL